jgi:thymidylate kinase
MRKLIAITGPIGAGKSTVAELVGRRLFAVGVTTALADLDDIAFSQRGSLELPEFWRRAGIAHAALVYGWFQAGVEVVVAHGPFFESRSYDALTAAAPADADVHHVLLRVSFQVALERVTGDPDRYEHALSTDPDFLRSTHEAFAERHATLPPPDLELDTSTVDAAEIAGEVAAFLLVED